MGAARFKGVGLERVVAELFRRRGYRVERDVRVVGRSGVRHQVDVLVSYDTPLYVSRVVVECKNQVEPVGKDVVMKVAEVVRDIGADKGIVVTTSYFTDDAVATARALNVELWDKLKLSSLLGEGFAERGVERGEASEKVGLKEPGVFYINPSQPPSHYERVLLKRFGSRVDFLFPAWYPYLEVEAEVLAEEGLFSKHIAVKNAKFVVDPFLGVSCYVSRSSVAPGALDAVRHLFDVRDEELAVMDSLARLGQGDVQALAGAMGVSVYRLRGLLPGLVAKGLVKVEIEGRRRVYGLARFESSYSLLSELYDVVEKPGEGWERVRKFFELEFTPRFLDVLGLLVGGKLLDVRVVNYPYFLVGVDSGYEKRVQVFDVVNGLKLDESKSNMLTKFYYGIKDAAQRFR